jgi:hypothetical protein
VIEGISGQEVRYDDQRVRMMPMSPIDSSGFESLSPGGVRELMNEAFRKNHIGEFQLTWGHSNFYISRPGKYRARATFESTRDSWAEKKGGPWHTEKDVWKGLLESGSVEVSLP